MTESQRIAEAAGMTRRSLIGAIALLFAAPAIVRASSLMHVKPLPQSHTFTVVPDWNEVQRLIVQLQPEGDWKVFRLEDRS